MKWLTNVYDRVPDFFLTDVGEQVAHAIESLTIWVIGFAFWGPWVGFYGAVSAVTLKEGADISTRIRNNRSGIWGDVLDFVVGVSVAVLLTVLAT